MPTPDSNIFPLHSESSNHERANKDALTQLFNKYGEKLRCDLQRYPSPRDDIEDAIQETFYRVLHGGHLGKLENPGAFLFKTARNILIDRYRKNKLEKNINDKYQLYTTTDSREEVVLEYSEMSIAYQRALSELPRKCRQIFLMRRFDGLSNSEIATNLGISVRMVQKHMIRALTHFNKCLR
jgi:RNA polymerase sigma factor (sigma-70 family)